MSFGRTVENALQNSGAFLLLTKPAGSTLLGAMAPQLFRHIDEMLTLSPAAQRGGRHIQEEHLGAFHKMAFLVESGKISWLGFDKKIPKEFAKKKIKEKSLKGLTVLPGFIECHTHSVFAGSRAAEFEMRNQGISYQEIAAKGGGILSTVRETRKASLQTLADLAQRRADIFTRQGVTCLEVKSGYGLTLKDEIKMLKAAKKISGPHVVTTFLGAHAKAPEFETYEDYLEALAEKYLPEIKKQKLAHRVDVFIEKGFFPVGASRGYLEAARRLGFQITVHADQLSLSGGTEVALQLEALSADHMICVKEHEIAKVAASELTAVLLPAADLYMKCPYPPARALLNAGARVALATDFNPGTSPTQNLNLVGLLARLEMKMSLAEVIAAYTVSASHALGLQRQMGSLELGKYADFMCIESSWRDLFYALTEPSVMSVYVLGRPLKIM